LRRRKEMRDGERQVALGGVQYRRAGCLLAPFIPLRAAGALVVTTERVIFEPLLHYKLVTRGFDIELDRIREADVSGSNVQVNLWDLVSVGKNLIIRLKDGGSYGFRSMEADQLARAINRLLGH